MKGQLQKIETLSDGSAKLSIYINKEDLIIAVPLAYQEVEINLPRETSSEYEAVLQEGIQIGRQQAIDAVLELGRNKEDGVSK